MKAKRLLSALVAGALALGVMSISAFAENESVIYVNAKNAQDTLDGKYGSIDGKTICFTESIPEVLELARATAYEGSNTTYYQNDVQVDTADSLSKSGWAKYYRTVKDVTFTSDEGVTLAGFNLVSTHIYNEGNYDYVRNQAVTSTNDSYYPYSSLENITFSGLTVSGNVSLACYLDTVANGITFDGCTFLGDAERMMSDINFAAVKMSGCTGFSNVTVKNCSITNYFQGIYIQGPNNITICNNYVNGTKHNAFAIQSYSSSDVSTSVKGAVSVQENYIENTSDRAIRFGDIEAETSIAINNNVMVNSGDTDGQLIKPGTVGAGTAVNLENNYWDGRTAAAAVSVFAAPESTGIVSGTFAVDVSDYASDSYTAVKNDDGTYSVCGMTSECINETVNQVTATGVNDTTATGFITKITANEQDKAFELNKIQWKVTSKDVSQKSNVFEVNLTTKGTVLIGLVVDGLYDSEASAEAVLN